MSETQHAPHPLVLVDGGSLYGGLKEFMGPYPRFHSEKLRQFLLSGEYAPRDYTRYYCYGVPPRPSEEGSFKSFLSRMKKSLWMIRQPEEENYIMEMMIWDASQFLAKKRDKINCLVLVSGSGQLIHTVNEYQSAGIPVTIVCAKTALAPSLRESLKKGEGCKLILLDDIFEQILLHGEHDDASEKGMNTRAAGVAE